MDKITINNLFPTTCDLQPLDIHSLYNSKQEHVKNKINFNIDRLINLRETRKKRVLIQYEKVYGMCLKKINMANNLNKTEVVYDVPEAAYGYFDYTSIECLKYIEERLKEMKLEILLLDSKSIYISWANICKSKND
jgi:hypothetical protein